MNTTTDLDGATHTAVVLRHLKLGDTIMHTRRQGVIEEHLFTGKRGSLICGKPSQDTIRLGFSSFPVSDIDSKNITHINRMPVSVLDRFAELEADCRRSA